MYNYSHFQMEGQYENVLEIIKQFSGNQEKTELFGKRILKIGNFAKNCWFLSDYSFLKQQFAHFFISKQNYLKISSNFLEKLIKSKIK